MKPGCRPYLISESGNAIALKRLSLKGSEINESFLQDLLDRTPDILPVSRLNPGFGPLASMGREIIKIVNLLIAPCKERGNA